MKLAQTGRDLAQSVKLGVNNLFMTSVRSRIDKITLGMTSLMPLTYQTQMKEHLSKITLPLKTHNVDPIMANEGR